MKDNFEYEYDCIIDRYIELDKTRELIRHNFFLTKIEK
jgi:hypothetical protein